MQFSTTEVDLLDLMKELILSNTHNTQKILLFLEQTKENTDKLQSKHDEILTTKLKDLEKLKAKYEKLCQEKVEVKAEMKRQSKEAREMLLLKMLEQNKHATENHKIQIVQEDLITTHDSIYQQINLTAGDDTLDEIDSQKVSVEMQQNNSKSSQQMTQRNSVMSASVPLTVQQPQNVNQSMRTVTENQCLNQQEVKFESTQKINTPLTKIINTNFSDPNQPCFAVGKRQEEEMDQFLKKIQIQRPGQTSVKFTNQEEVKVAPPISLETEVSKPKVEVKQVVVPQTAHFCVAKTIQPLEIQSSFNNSLRNDASKLDDSKITEDGMKSKADFFLQSDSDEEAGEILLELKIRTSSNQTPLMLERANKDFKEKLDEKFDDYKRMQERLSKTNIKEIEEFLEQFRQELYCMKTDLTRQVEVSNIEIKISDRQKCVFSCLEGDSSYDQGFDEVLKLIQEGNLDITNIKFKVY